MKIRRSRFLALAVCTVLLISCTQRSEDESHLQVNDPPRTLKVTHFEFNDFDVAVKKDETYRVVVEHISSNYDQYGVLAASTLIMDQDEEVIALTLPSDKGDVELEFVAPYDGDVIIYVSPPSPVDDNFVGEFTLQILSVED
jgi:hypothetical protein